MVEPKIIQQQLRELKFGGSPWNQAELRELPKIIHEGEKISECVNGFYEGGVALLVATELRVLLIDKKPLRFLNVEDLRFDMINEIDYSHRLMGATITISTGSKNLKFKSYNQERLRHLIELVQEHMSHGKKDQAEKAHNQQQHLEEINKQLQMYLMAQHQQLQQQIQSQAPAQVAPLQLPKPDPQLSDYLFAQRLLEQFQRENNGSMPPAPQAQAATVPAPALQIKQEPVSEPPANPADLVADAKREVFGHSQTTAPVTKTEAKSHIKKQVSSSPTDDNPAMFFKGLEINPLRIAYSKLPMMLRNRKFGRPSLHAHTQQQAVPTGQTATPATY